MADNKNCVSLCSSKGGVVLNVNRVLDSCRDKDCFEDVKVFLTPKGQDIIEKTASLKVKSTETLWTGLTVEPVRFNRGFYSVDVRFYVKLIIEACVCVGKTVEFEGLAVCDKKVILYGGEGNVSVFRSSEDGSGFCKNPFAEKKGSSLPFAVCEVADPIDLNIRVVKYDDRCGCCCCYADEVPESICSLFDGNFIDTDEEGRRELLVSLGFFSVIRLERPGQYLVNATECCVPEKECACDEVDPCTVFRHMDFPVGEFCTSCDCFDKIKSKKCGCKS